MPPHIRVVVPLEVDETGCLLVPKDAHIEGLLDLRDCEFVTSLPENLRADAVDLRGTRIKQLPPRMHVKDWVDIQGTEIELTALPQDLEIGTSLYYNDSPNGETLSILGSALASRNGAHADKP
jgi:hypothetical protein